MAEERYIAGEECWATFGDYRMRYLRVGPAQVSGGLRPPLLLIHGFMGYSFSWRHNFRELSRERVVYAVDLLGVGHSDRPPRGSVDFSLPAIADRMLGWIESMGLRGVDILGTSHGGGVAMFMAAHDARRATGLVNRLILVAPANPFSTAGKKRIWIFNTSFGAWILRKTSGGTGGVNAWALGRMYGDPTKISDETRVGYNGPMQIPGTLDYALEVIGHWTRDMKSLSKAIGDIRVPTLLLWGDSDKAVPAPSAYKLHASLPESNLVVLPDVGHLPYEESPEEFNRIVLGFLQGSSVRSESGSVDALGV